MKSKTVLLSILIVFMTACSGVPMINMETRKVGETAAEIADFNLPDGYYPEFSASLLGYTIVAFTPGDGHSHLYLIQSEKASDADKLEEMLSMLAPGSMNTQTRMTVLETKTVTVHGLETTMVISKGINSTGHAYRQAIVVFQGNGGPAMLVFSEPADHWDQNIVDALVASIH